MLTSSWEMRHRNVLSLLSLFFSPSSPLFSLYFFSFSFLFSPLSFSFSSWLRYVRCVKGGSFFSTKKCRIKKVRKAVWSFWRETDWWLRLRWLLRRRGRGRLACRMSSLWHSQSVPREGHSQNSLLRMWRNHRSASLDVLFPTPADHSQTSDPAASNTQTC